MHDKIIKLSKTEILDALSFVGTIIPNRPTHPILSCCHLSALLLSENKEETLALVTISGFDLKTGISNQIVGNIIYDEIPEVEFINVCISYKQLFPAVKAMKREINFIFSEDEDGDISVLIKDDSTEINIICMKGEEFPVMQEISKDSSVLSFAQDKKDFISKVNQVLPCVSSEETQQILTGINLSIASLNKKVFSMVFRSTNTHIASLSYPFHHDKKEAGFKENLNITIDGKTLKLIAKTSDKSNSEKIDLTIGKTLVSFKVDNTFIVSNLLFGEYPNLEMLFPYKLNKGKVERLNQKKVQPSIVRFNKKKLETRINALNEFSPIDITVTVTAKDGGLLEIDKPDASIFIKDKIECEFISLANKHFSFLVNFKYLKDTIHSFDSESIYITQDPYPTAPLILASENSQSQNTLLMPMQKVP